MAGTVIDTLFGDLPSYAWPPGDDVAEFPWTAFVEARRDPGRAVELWQQVAAADVAPRHVAQAWYFLRAHGVQPAPEEQQRVLGLVMEIGLKWGADVLAVYADRNVRYYKQAGGGVVLGHAEGEQAELVDALLAASAEVVARTGAGSGHVPAPPHERSVRLTFLTPGGVHRTEGPMEQLGGAVLTLATRLLTQITAGN